MAIISMNSWPIMWLSGDCSGWIQLDNTTSRHISEMAYFLRASERNEMASTPPTQEEERLNVFAAAMSAFDSLESA